MVVVFQSRLGPGTVSEPESRQLTRPLYAGFQSRLGPGTVSEPDCPVQILAVSIAFQSRLGPGTVSELVGGQVVLFDSWSCFNPVLVRAPSPSAFQSWKECARQRFQSRLGPGTVSEPRRVAIGIAATTGEFQSRLGPGTVSERAMLIARYFALISIPSWSGAPSPSVPWPFVRLGIGSGFNPVLVRYVRASRSR